MPTKCLSGKSAVYADGYVHYTWYGFSCRIFVTDADEALKRPLVVCNINNLLRYYPYHQDQLRPFKPGLDWLAATFSKYISEIFLQYFSDTFFQSKIPRS